MSTKSLIVVLGYALVPLASVALVRDWNENGPDMIDGPDLAITPKHVRAARSALALASAPRSDEVAGLKAEIDRLKAIIVSDTHVLLTKRPVAFRVKDYADGWILFDDEETANLTAEKMGAHMQGLYARTVAFCPDCGATLPTHKPGCHDGGGET